MIFFKELVKGLIDEGHTVDIMCNETEEKVDDCYHEWGCKVYHHCCSRSPLSTQNVKAVRQIKQLVEENEYDMVHCHTPVASICTRFACKDLRKSGLKVIYTAHGFHFYKGAPLKNWLLFYPIEKLCSRYTDVLITINKEDYDFAKLKMRCNTVEFVPGVGIDVDKFKNVVADREQKRAQLSIPDDAFLITSVGEVNENKNHKVVINALAQLNDKNVHYVVAGSGPLEDYLKKLAKELGVSNQVHILGYRDDIAQLYKVSDVCCFPSVREGLGLAAIEGMACGLPVIASDNRGTREYMTNRKTGFVCDANDSQAFAKAIKTIRSDKKLYSEIKAYNKEKALK